jgi:hypothetical protein
MKAGSKNEVSFNSVEAVFLYTNIVKNHANPNVFYNFAVYNQFVEEV